MGGWNLYSGEYNDYCKSVDDFWEIINYFLSNKTNKTTSYKFCFFKSILDNIFNVDDSCSISYNFIFERFTEIYWNLIVKYKLCQIQATSKFSKSTVEIIIDQFLKENNIDDFCSFEALKDELKNRIVSKVTSKCSIYVVGAFYEDTKQVFYSFDKKIKRIIFNKQILDYLIRYKNILTKLNYYEWIKFLEKTNNELSVLALAEKLDYSSKRNDLSFYKDFLIEIYGNTKCFYCGKVLKRKEIEMDHFIPWSFVKDDKIWNLVISCKKCNLSKSDKLAPRALIEKINNQNKYIMRQRLYNTFKREYLSYNDTKIENMYNSAIFNGYNDWIKS